MALEHEIIQEKLNYLIFNSVDDNKKDYEMDLKQESVFFNIVSEIENLIKDINDNVE